MFAIILTYEYNNWICFLCPWTSNIIRKRPCFDFGSQGHYNLKTENSFLSIT
jgi:hypothetical protein